MKFYDTNALIDLQDDILKDDFCISYITLAELEGLKNDKRKDAEFKRKAKHISDLLRDNSTKYEVMNCCCQKVNDLLHEYDLDNINDNKICAMAKIKYDQMENKEDFVFVTNDTLCFITASQTFHLKTESAIRDIDLYKGYIELEMSEEEMSNFFSNPTENTLNLNINEYVIITNLEKENVYKWTGVEYIPVFPTKYKSAMFGNTKPLNNLQLCAMDSIENNKITMLYGKASSGKTYLPLSYAEAMVEKGKYKNITFIYSYDMLKGSNSLGYEKGEHMDKLLNYGSIGGILSSKYGDIMAVEQKMIRRELDIIPTSSIRGISIKDSIVIVTEAQNLDAYTLKTIIQRCEFNNCKLIIEGDMIEQKDVQLDIGGMERFINIFSNNNEVGIVKLKGNYRSQLGELADEM